jgi:hypothetical protein
MSLDHPQLAPPVDVVRTDESGDVDLEQVEHNLSLTPAQRLELNDRFAAFVAVVREGGRKFYGKAS